MNTRKDATLNKYKRYKNKLTSILRQAEKDYFSRKILEAKDNIAKTWSILNRMTRKNNGKNVVNKIVTGNTVISDPAVIAGKFNEFFVNVGSDLVKKNSNWQFGFREKLSTSMALLELVDKLSEATDNKLISIGVFIDLAKAFDTVNHKILLGKLEHYGIRGVTLSWFRSYLTNRKQYVVIDKDKSDCAQITCGVPQGSILGPLLFLVYINDLNYASKILQTIMFADDTNLFLTGKSLDDLEMKMNDELKIISKWFKANLLSLNIDKTSYMIFGNKKYQNLSLLIENSPILRQFETKFFGVILSANLKWSKHIDVVLNKISKSIGIVSKVRHLIPPNLTRMLRIYQWLNHI